MATGMANSIRCAVCTVCSITRIVFRIKSVVHGTLADARWHGLFAKLPWLPSEKLKYEQRILEHAV